MGSLPPLVAPSPEECRKAIQGRWSWIPGLVSYQPGFRLFRRVFHTPVPRRAVLYVSADCRYRLSLDGAFLAAGPVKSPPYYKQLARVEMELMPGRHVLGAEVAVWADGWFGSTSPFSEMHLGGGLYVSCREEGLDLSTPGEWRGRTDPSRRSLSPQEEVSPGDFLFATTREETDFSLDPGEWTSPDFDDRDWQTLVPLDRGPNVHGCRLCPDPGTTWAMDMPQVRPLRRTPMPLSVLEDGGVQWRPGRGGEVVGRLPAGRTSALLAFPRYFTGYLRASGDGGAGVVRLRQSERRDEPHWQDDVLKPAGSPWRMETFDIRAAAFLRVVADLESPLELTLGADFASYDFGPFREYAAPGKPWLERIYQVGVHTALCCAHDTYEDCPFHERFQYVGDTRIQALISYEATGTGELGRKAILDFQRSQAPDGLVQSRFPSSLPQFIPGYALLWVLMIDDYLRYFPDDALRHSLLWNVQGVLKYYRDRVSPGTGLAGHPGHWGFSDWVEEWSYGDPSRDEASPTAIENLFYALALEAGERMAAAEGEEALSQAWRRERASLVAALKAHCWDEERGLFRDVPGKPWYSRHAQALAVLAEAVPPEGLASVRAALLEEREGMCGCSLYFQFYVLEALRRLKDLPGLEKALAPWRQCLEEFPWLTTFPEVPDARKARSMCHAWSASPVYFLLKCGLA